MKIRTKIFLSNLVIVLLLLSVLSYIWVNRGSKIILENIIENANLSLAQVAANLDNKLLSYEEITNTLYSDNTLQREFIQHYDDLREAYDIYFNKQQPYEKAIQTTKDVYRLDIYTDNPTYVFANVHLIDERVENSDWYAKVMENPTGSLWTGVYNSQLNNTQVFSIKKRLNNLVKQSKLVVSVEIHTRVLYELINEESKGKRYIFALNDGTILMDSARTGKFANVGELPFHGRILGSEKANFTYNEDDQPYLVIHQTLRSRDTVSGMKVISFIPLDDLMPKVNEMRNLAIVWLFVTCGISGILIFVFSVGLTRRISELSLKMRRVDKDNFQTSVNVRGKDEISQLGLMFNLMVQRIGQLIQEVYQSEIDRKETALRTKEVELYALQTQINPHFLFNILNMIRGKMLISGDRENAKIVGLLAKSFRMMLKAGGQTIPLSEEIEFIDNYLQLQKYRYADKFDYTIDIPVELQDIYIPKLILQPLVENAISHGIELKESKSTVHIRGERNEDGLLLTIKDTGLGITADRLNEIHRWLDEEATLSRDKHIGLQNVHSRLKNLYGETSGLSIESEEGTGTSISFIIPDKTIMRGDRDV